VGHELRSQEPLKEKNKNGDEKNKMNKTKISKMEERKMWKKISKPKIETDNELYILNHIGTLHSMLDKIIDILKEKDIITSTDLKKKGILEH
jgi:hypothetical protein